MHNNILSGDEWIGFQTIEGPCSVGCDYCYEREKALSLLAKAQEKGKIQNFHSDISNKQLAALIRTNAKNLDFFLPLKEFEKYLSFFKAVHINRAFLVGSEPTEHPDFKKILNLANQNNISLLIYTSGRKLDRLSHPAVKFIVLHLDYQNSLMKRPSDDYMKKINDLLNADKEIHFRVNFNSPDLCEKDLIYSFYDRIDRKFLKSLLLKFSFTTKLANIPSVKYYTPDSMKQVSEKIMGFVDEFKLRYPEAPIISERPLFRCSFEDDSWQKYQKKGGFTSKCEMEFVVYPKEGLTLCPPARHLIKGKDIKSPEELVETINELKEQIKEIMKKPSFEVCRDCNFRLDSSCQGGCFGYK